MLVLDSTHDRLLRVDGSGKVSVANKLDGSPSKLAAFGKAIYVAFGKSGSAAPSIRRY